jgi:calcitonin receptor-like
MSLALSCLAWLLWYHFVVFSSDVVKENHPWCIALHIITQYLMLCNYFWMFCEGVHLHLVLVVVFVKDTVAMKLFHVIGWLMPTVFVGAYTFLRFRHAEDSKM